MQASRQRRGLLAVAGILLAATTGLLVLAPRSGAMASRVVLSPTGTTGWKPDSRSVTLITGDRVVLAGGGAQPLVQAGPGRSAASFMVRWERGHLYVLPGDALAMVAGGRMDRRLFDVTGLLDNGYDDASRGDIPVIIQYQQPVAGRRLHDVGATAQRELPAVRGLALRQAKRDAPRLWSSVTRRATDASPVRGAAAPRRLGAGIAHVWLDGQRTLTLDRSVPQIGAPAAWQAGLTGDGVTVAVLDSGIDPGHPDLAGRIAAARNFTTGPAGDQDGHGTHVASIIAGSGAASSGRYRGVAPGARLLDGKVCDRLRCADSAILAGMSWAVEEQGARVVNLSLGAPDTPGEDPLEQAVDTLSARHGTLFVVSAGNGGSGAASMDSPATADTALAVGAVDRTDTPADFSSRGPRAGDAAVKPDLTAPGVGIVAARAQGSTLGEPVDDHYTGLSGTSMAAPHVSGAAAVLTQQHPAWTGEQLKAALMASAAPSGGVSAFTQGAGRVDVARAIGQTVTATPASLSFGLQRWPHIDDQPVTRTVTFRNAGADQVGLDLSVDATGSDGSAAPVGMFSVQPARVTVPAGGQAQVSVTADTSASVTARTGAFGGELVATGGQVRVSIPFGVAAEAESYDLTMRHLGRDGAAAGAYQTYLGELRNDCTVCDVFVSEPEATTTVRLPRGDYLLDSTVTTEGTSDENHLVQPLLRLDHDTSVVLDARLAKPFDLTVPRKSGELFTFRYAYQRMFSSDEPAGLLAVWTPSGPLSQFRTAQLGPEVPDSLLENSVYAAYAQAGSDGDFVDSPNVTNLAWTVRGQVFSGLIRNVQQRQLATVHATYLATAANRTALKNLWAWSDGGSLGIYSTQAPRFHLPFTRTEHYLADGGHTWQADFEQDAPGPEQPWDFFQYDQGHAYQPGRTYQEQWAGAVIGPRIPNSMPLGDPGVRRRDDSLFATVAMFSDSTAGHWSPTRGTAPGRTVLYRDGVLIAQQPTCCALFVPSLPPEPATYRLDIDGDYGFSTVSSRVTGSWTFHSGHLDGSEWVALPLMVVRYTPHLDDRYRAPASVTFPVPITIERQPGAPTADVRSMTIEVSVDDGSTWQRIPLAKQGNGWVATVHNPASGFVSLRATASDSTGSTVQQTIIRAYGIRAAR